MRRSNLDGWFFKRFKKPNTYLQKRALLIFGKSRSERLIHFPLISLLSFYSHFSHRLLYNTISVCKKRIEVLSNYANHFCNTYVYDDIYIMFSHEMVDAFLSCSYSKCHILILKLVEIVLPGP